MRLDRVLLVLAVALSRWLFRSQYLYNLDSVNFALGLARFDPSVHQPHPPGYFLYVHLAGLVNLVFHDANASLVALSVVFSCGTVALIYALTDEWFGRMPALFAGLMFLFSPLCWFHGTVALLYIVEGFFSALLGYLFWKIYSGKLRLALPASAVLGIAAGFRPSSLFFLGPLWLFSLYKAGSRRVLLAFGTLALTLGCWFVPMLIESGGLAAYSGALTALWGFVPSKQNAAAPFLVMSAARFCTILAALGMCFGSAVLLTLRSGGGVRSHAVTARFTWIWIAPPLLFFTFVFFNYVNSGYVTVVLPPLFAWLGLRAADWYGAAVNRTTMKIAALVICAAIHTAFFLFAPVYCSYGAVRQFETELTEIHEIMRGTMRPDNALIVGFDSHFLGYRHAGYYLPEFLTVQYPELPLPTGLQVFAMTHGQTRLLRRIPLERFEHFVFFPLPEGDRYRQYTNRVAARLSGRLRTLEAHGRKFLTGPAADLPALFPRTAVPPPAMYTEFHSGY